MSLLLERLPTFESMPMGVFDTSETTNGMIFVVQGLNQIISGCAIEYILSERLGASSTSVSASPATHDGTERELMDLVRGSIELQPIDGVVLIASDDFEQATRDLLCTLSMETSMIDCPNRIIH